MLLCDLMIIYTDGACSGNPGPMGIGAVLIQNGKIVKEISEDIGSGTNNIAEYTAVIRALQEAEKFKPQHVTVRSDSLLLIMQLNGKYRIKVPHLRELMHQVALFKKKFTIIFEHVPRQQNARADELSKRAIGLKL